MAKIASSASRGARVRVAFGTLVAIAAFVLGVALAAVGGRFGPALMLALPLAALGAAIILARPALGIAAVYLSFPAGFLSLPTDALGIQAAEAAVLLVLGVIAMRRLWAGEIPLPWSPPMWWGLLLASWAILATPGALDLGVAIKADAQLLGGMLLALAVLAVLPSLQEARPALATLLVVGTGMALFGLREVSDIRAAFGGTVVAGRAQGVFTQPNELGAFSAIMLMVALGWVFAAPTKTAAAGGIIAAVSLAAALMMSLSRGAWIGAALASLLMLLLLPAARRTVVVLGIPAVVIGLALAATLAPPDPPQVEVVRQRLLTVTRPGENPYDNRPAIYREALREIRERPVLGQGPGNFPVASARSGSLARTVGAVHAHNVLLTVGAEIGLPGVAWLIGLTVGVGLVVFAGARRLADPKDRALLVGIGCGLTAQLGQGIVDFNFRNPVLSILVWSLVGMVLVARRQLTAESAAARRAVTAAVPEP